MRTLGRALAALGTITSLAAVAFVTRGPRAEAAASTPRELGKVKWHRDFDAARARADETGKPLLILFDEVPGCQTCVRYGQAVLSDPLIVEAAETEFVPVAVYNNVGGKDREVLKRFDEPTWNNPVVRIVDPKLHDLVPRVSGDYSKRGLVTAMQDALQKADRPVPGYLGLLAEELSVTRPKTTHFSMYCFWSGEVCLGQLPGVLSTRAGFAEGKEVVEVVYDPRQTSQADLQNAAKSCGQPLETSRFRFSAKDDKYQTRHTPLRGLQLSPLQATRVNSAIGKSQDPRRFLSPRQARKWR